MRISTVTIESHDGKRSVAVRRMDLGPCLWGSMFTHPWAGGVEIDNTFDMIDCGDPFAIFRLAEEIADHLGDGVLSESTAKIAKVLDQIGGAL